MAVEEAEAKLRVNSCF